MTPWWRGWLDLVAPPLCAGCGKPVDRAEVLCTGCASGMHRAGAVPGLPRLDACFAAVLFAGSAESWIHRFKYPRPGLAGLDPAAGAVARRLAAEAARLACDPPDLVVPEPLHPHRLRSRKFPSSRPPHRRQNQRSPISRTPHRLRSRKSRSSRPPRCLSIRRRPGSR